MMIKEFNWWGPEIINNINSEISNMQQQTNQIEK